MGLPSTMIWEVRTTGSDNNGGGFVSGGTGTDYSQQDASQFSGTNLAGASANTGTPTITSVTHNFVSTDVDNIIHITAGTNWTQGFYRIVSVSANAATLDRQCASVASPTSGTWAVGGALATPQKVIGNLSNTAASGYKVYLKAGSYTFSASISNSTAYQYIVEGYNATRGDNPTGTSRPLWTTATNSIYMFQLANNSLSAGNSPSTFVNIRFSNTAVTRAACFGNNFSGLTTAYSFYNCKFTGFTRALDGGSNTLTITVTFNNCEIDTCTDASGAIALTGASTIIMSNCYVHDSTGSGIYCNFGGAVHYIIVGCVFYKNGVNGINHTTGANGLTLIQDCVFSDNTTDGYAFSSSSVSIGPFYCYNNIFYNNGGWGININTSVSISSPVIVQNNAFAANSSGTHQWGTTGIGANFGYNSNDVTLGGDPFNGRTSGDFSLSLNASGAACRATGYPGATGIYGTGYVDIGVLQHQDSSAVINRIMNIYEGV